MSKDLHYYARLAERFIRDRYGNPSTLRFHREEWWVWTDGCYRQLTDSDLRGFLLLWLDEENEACNIAAVRELRASVAALPNVAISGTLGMPLYLEVGYYDHTCNYLSFKNQLVDLDVLIKDGVRGVLRAPTPNWFSPVAFTYDYDPQALCPRFLALLDRVLPDKVSQEVIQEWFGYCLTNDTSRRAMLILYGESGTGKSTLCNVLEALVGPENRSAVPLEGFWDRFAAQQTVGKLVNLCGDSKKIESLAEGVIKRFTGGDTLLVDRKYRDPVSCKMTAKIVVATNTFPKIKDISDALWNRFIVVPMDVRIPPDEMDLSLLDSEKTSWPLRKELPGIFNWAVRGLKRLKQQGHFTVSQQLAQAKAQARHENCSVSMFVDDRCEASTYVVPVKRFMHEYKCYCDAENLRALEGPEVGRILRRLLPGIQKQRFGPRGQRQMHYVGLTLNVPRDS